MRANPFASKTSGGMWALIVVLAAGYGIEMHAPEHMLDLFGLWPVGGAQGFAVYQLASYTLLHNGLLHLGANLFMLWMFGRGIEMAWGTRGLLLLFWCGSAVAGLTHIALASLGWVLPDPVIGASGGVAALLGSFVWLYPCAGVLWLLPPIPMRAWVGIGLLFLIELGLLITGVLPSIAHDAHLGGFVCGLTVAIGTHVFRVRNTPDTKGG